MDVPGAIGELNRVKGSIEELRNDDKQICQLIALVCDALCGADQAVRDRVSARLEDRMDELFPDNAAAFRARTLHYGLGLALRQLEQ
jgi:hypothetical protein